MRRFSRRERVLIVFCALLAVVVGGQWALRPALDRFAAASAALARQQAAIHKAGQLAQRLPRLNQEIALLRTQVGALSVYAERVVPEVMQQVQAAAQRSGVTLSSIRPLAPQRLDGLTAHEIQFQFDSSFPSAISLLYDLEKEGSKLAITRVQISSASQTSDAVRMTVSVAAYSVEEGGRDEKKRKSESPGIPRRRPAAGLLGR